MYVCYFKQLQIEGELLDAIGIFKSESKEPFLKVAQDGKNFQLNYEEQAINIKKHIALPVLESNQRNMVPTLTDSIENLERGPYGTRQPRLDATKALDVRALDAVIVPGLGFDKANNRLGRGAGYYDRFLGQLPKTTATIGIAFDFQVVDRLPTEDHDVPLHLIIAG